MTTFPRAILIGTCAAACCALLSLVSPNSWLEAPGIVITFFINGGGHENHIGSLGWKMLPFLFNALLYSLATYLILWSYHKFVGLREQDLAANSRQPRSKN